MSAEVRVEVDERPDVVVPDEPDHPWNYYGWDIELTVADRTCLAYRTKDLPESVTFLAFSDPSRGPQDWREPFRPDDPSGDRKEPFRDGRIPYDDPLFCAAARAAFALPGVSVVKVDSSNETGRPLTVDRARLV